MGSITNNSYIHQMRQVSVGSTNSTITIDAATCIFEHSIQLLMCAVITHVCVLVVYEKAFSMDKRQLWFLVNFFVKLQFLLK